MRIHARRELRRRLLAIPMVVSIALVSLPTQRGVVMAAAKLSPSQEAATHAAALRLASTDYDAGRVVKLLLGRLKVPVLPDTYGGDGIGVYEFQIGILARTLREGKLTRLETIAGVGRAAYLVVVLPV
jgi:hypothetical protein